MKFLKEIALKKQTNLELFLWSEFAIHNFQFFKNFGADGSGICVPEDLITVFNSCFFPFLPCIFSVLFLSKDCASFLSCIDELTQGGHSSTMWTIWGRGSKMPVFVRAQGIKTVHAEGGGRSRNGKILSKYLLNDP